MRRTNAWGPLLLLPTIAFAVGVPCLAQPAPSPRTRGQAPAAPPVDPVSPALRQALAAEWLSDEERRDLRVRHGLWEEGDLDSPARRARAALDDLRLLDPALRDPDAPRDLRAEGMLARGELEEALALLPEADSARALRLRAECLERLGRLELLLAEIDAQAPRLAADPLLRDDPDAVADLAGALLVRARVAGEPPEAHRAVMAMLARARGELDRLHVAARLAESELLLEKDNPEEAGAALVEAISLHPRLARAWGLAGRVALERFDFDSAEKAARTLRSIDPEHPLAALLDARAALLRNDPDAAEEQLDAVLAALPRHPEALALAAAVDAARYDFDAMQARLAALDEAMPRHPEPWLEAGRQLAMDRQYAEAAEVLAEASRRRPEWPTPRIDLAMLELQSGRDAVALAELREIAARDPFNRRAANSLRLLEEIAGYERIRSERFEIRFKGGIDAVVAELMPDALDRMHEEVAARFDHEPPAPTVIEVLPDHPTFAVRITAMPWIHTVAACTGPVIAMEVPRRGPPKKHLGPFDWLEVLRHEYAHTVTLSATRNRIPHWFTEAAATSVETVPRDYPTCMLLARSLLADELLSLDEIDWAFVRPKKPTDRTLAYAQGRWMLEFMDEAFGPGALVALLGRFRDGKDSRAAFAEVLGVEPDEFESRFLAWAREEVRGWGLDPRPSIESLLEAQAEADAAAVEVTAAGDDDSDAPADEVPPAAQAIGEARLAAWLAEHPDHPDLLELAIRRRLGDRDELPDDVEPLLERYAAARPVDPYPHRVLARAHLASEDPLRAIPHLEALDRVERDENAYSIELARLLRRAGRSDEALVAVMKATRIDPYDAPLRELAAAIALEAGAPELCRLHLRALLLLEPDRPQHQRRLEALEKRLGAG